MQMCPFTLDPHILTKAQKLRKLEDAKAMLQILLQAQADG